MVTCRICLGDNAIISVFDLQNDIPICDKIMRCARVTVKEGDQLPNLVCYNCVNELSVTYDFIKKCESSDEALRLVQKDVLIKEEDIKEELDYDDSFIPQDDYVECTPSYTKKTKSKTKKKKGKSGPIQCIVCGLLAMSLSALETHMRTHTGEKPYTCAECGWRYPTKGALKRHTETFHSQRERKFTCETCGNSFFRKCDIITHLRVHTDEKPYVCPFCSKAFRQIASLNRHKRIHTGEKPYSCPICDKKFADKNVVKKHQSVHSNEKNFRCHLCSKCVKTKSALDTHLSLHTNSKQNICNFCGMAFAMKGNLKIHIKRIHSEKSGQCTICMKSFSNIQEHMRKHTGEKPYVCDLCGHALTSKQGLTHHIAFKHENVDKFKCSIGDCTKTFPTTMMLEFHLLKHHTNHTPFVCQHCSRGFFRNSDLSRHIKVSHMSMA